MKTSGLRGVALCAPALMLVMTAHAHADGFIWQRNADWVPGTAPGGTANNPGPGAGGSVWQYEWTQGGNRHDPNPWYAQPGNLMSWDAQWYDTGLGVWSRGDNVNPPIHAARLVHNVHDSVVDTIPVVRWRTPFGPINDLAISGSLIVHWSGMNDVGKAVDVDVVIALQNADRTITTPLLITTVSKPNLFPSVGDVVSIPVNLQDIALDAGSSIIITHRGRHGFSPEGAWVNLWDNLVFTAIPAPGSVAVLAFGMIAMGRRRRR